MSRPLIWYPLLMLLITLSVGGCATPEGVALTSKAGNTHSVESSGDDSTQSDFSSAPPIARSLEDDLETGQREENAGRFPEAKLAYERVIGREPSHPRANHRLAVIADRMGQFAAADWHYKKALQFTPLENRSELSHLYGDVGYSYLLREQYENSERALTEALRHDNQNQIALRNFGLLHGRRGSYDQAFQAFIAAEGEAAARSRMNLLFPDWEETGIASTGPAQFDETNHFPNDEAAGASRANAPNTVLANEIANARLISEAGNRNPRSTGGPERPAMRFPRSGSLQAPIPVRKRQPRPVISPAPHQRAAETELAGTSQPETVAQTGFMEEGTMPPIRETGAVLGNSQGLPNSGASPTVAETRPLTNPSNIALQWGSAIGPGGMFPTTTLQNTGPLTQRATSHPPHTAPSRGVIQTRAEENVSAERPSLPGDDAVRRFDAAFEVGRQQTVRRRELQRLLNGNREP